MFVSKNIRIEGAAGKPIWLDVFAPDPIVGTSVCRAVVYAHGFCGFKDWGNFDLIAARFAQAGMVFIKFNFSHNGMSNGNIDHFDELEAFGQNNYSKQLLDLGLVIDWVQSGLHEQRPDLVIGDIGLIGHSMGGAVAILYAAKDHRICRLATWAATAACKTPWANWSAAAMDEWKTKGVAYYRNGRTRQDMPLYYQLYEDFLRNETSRDVPAVISGLSMPVLLCHGSEDVAVPLSDAVLLHQRLPTARFVVLPTDHVFGRSHPWTGNELPSQAQALVTETIRFFT